MWEKWSECLCKSRHRAESSCARSKARTWATDCEEQRENMFAKRVQDVQSLVEPVNTWVVEEMDPGQVLANKTFIPDHVFASHKEQDLRYGCSWAHEPWHLSLGTEVLAAGFVGLCGREQELILGVLFPALGFHCCFPSFEAPVPSLSHDFLFYSEKQISSCFSSLAHPSWVTCLSDLIADCFQLLFHPQAYIKVASCILLCGFCSINSASAISPSLHLSPSLTVSLRNECEWLVISPNEHIICNKSTK